MNRSSIESFAHQTLLDHGIYSIPVDPVVLANKLNIRVSNAVFSEPTLSGMIAKRGENTSLLVNANDSILRKRFTIAHELGHKLLHLQKDGEFIDNELDLFRNENDSQNNEKYFREVEANQFAAALLMDADLVKKLWPDYESIEKMAELFKVSKSAMGIRVSSLGLI